MPGTESLLNSSSTAALSLSALIRPWELTCSPDSLTKANSSQAWPVKDLSLLSLIKVWNNLYDNKTGWDGRAQQPVCAACSTGCEHDALHFPLPPHLHYGLWSLLESFSCPCSCLASLYSCSSDNKAKLLCLYQTLLNNPRGNSYWRLLGLYKGKKQWNFYWLWVCGCVFYKKNPTQVAGRWEVFKQTYLMD